MPKSLTPIKAIDLFKVAGGSFDAILSNDATVEAVASLPPTTSAVLSGSAKADPKRLERAFFPVLPSDAASKDAAWAKATGVVGSANPVLLVNGTARPEAFKADALVDALRPIMFGRAGGRPPATVVRSLRFLRESPTIAAIAKRLGDEARASMAPIGEASRLTSEPSKTRLFPIVHAVTGTAGLYAQAERTEPGEGTFERDGITWRFRFPLPEGYILKAVATAAAVATEPAA